MELTQKKQISYNDLGCKRKLTKGYNSGHLCGVADGWGKEHFCQECKAIEKTLWKRDSEKHREERENYLNNKGGNK